MIKGKLSTKEILVLTVLCAIGFTATLLFFDVLSLHTQIRHINQKKNFLIKQNSESKQKIKELENKLDNEINQNKQDKEKINKALESYLERRRIERNLFSSVPDRGGDWLDRLRTYLAPTRLAGQERTFYLAAIDNGIDIRLMPSIAKLESGCGAQNANTNNFWGRKAISGGWMAFASKEDSIWNEARYLKTNYYDNGLTSISAIVNKYAPASDGNSGYADHLQAEMSKI